MAIDIAANSAHFSVKGLITQAWSGLPTNDTSLTDLAFPDYNFGSGNGTGNINLGAFAEAKTLTASASVTYDLTSYPNRAGVTVSTMTKLKILWIYCLTGKLDIGNAAANQLVGDGFLKSTTHVWTLQALEVLPIVSRVGITVGPTIKDLKILDASGSGSTFNIFWTGSVS